MSETDVLERIEYTINKIRPYIQADGGDVRLIDFKDGIVTVEMLGACAGCMAINTTLIDGIQAILLDEVPEVKEVRLNDDFELNDLDATDNSPGGYSYY